jgi:hypothetical protein
MRKSHLTAAMLCAFTLCGCSNVPNPHYFDGTGGDNDAKGPPTVKSLFAHIECEVQQAAQSQKLLAQRGNENAVYVANVVLTLDVADSGNVSPTLSYLLPWGSTGFSLTGAPNYKLTRQRTFSLEYTLDVNKLVAAAAGNGTKCNDVEIDGLAGDLGIEAIVKNGIAASGIAAFTIPGKEKKSKLPNFSSTVKFAVVKSIDAGPNWTLVHFKGPGEKLLGLNRTNTDTLSITFAPGENAVHQYDAETLRALAILNEEMLKATQAKTLWSRLRDQYDRLNTKSGKRTPTLTVRLETAKKELDDAKAASDAAEDVVEKARDTVEQWRQREKNAPYENAEAEARQLRSTLLLQNLGILNQ